MLYIVSISSHFGHYFFTSLRPQEITLWAPQASQSFHGLFLRASSLRRSSLPKIINMFSVVMSIISYISCPRLGLCKPFVIHLVEDGGSRFPLAPTDLKPWCTSNSLPLPLSSYKGNSPSPFRDKLVTWLSPPCPLFGELPSLYPLPVTKPSFSLGSLLPAQRHSLILSTFKKTLPPLGVRQAIVNLDKHNNCILQNTREPWKQ